MERLGKKDKAVIRAFTEKRAKEGHKLRTDGRRIDIISLGGDDIAHWKDGKIHFPGSHGSRSGQLVERAIAREAPRNDLYNGRGYNPADSNNLFQQIEKQEGEEIAAALAISFASAHDSVGTTAILRAFNRLQRAGAYSPAGTKHRDLTTYLHGSWFQDGWEDRQSWAELNDEAHEYLDAANRNPARQKNSHDPSKSVREMRRALDYANENITESAEAGDRGNASKMLKHVIIAASAVGRAGAEMRYAGDEAPQALKDEYDALAVGLRHWGDQTFTYMRDMGIAANPRRRKRTRNAKRVKNQHHKSTPNKFTEIPKRNAGRKRRRAPRS